MKNKILFGLATALALSAASAAGAQEVTETATSGGQSVKVKVEAKLGTTTKVDAEAKRSEIRAQIETKKLELKEKNGTSSERAGLTQVDRVEKVAKQAYERLARAVEKLSSIEERIVAVLAKFETRGADVTVPREKLETSSKLMTEAKAALEAISAIDLSTSTPRENAKAVKEAVKDAQEAVIAAHRALNSVIPSIKGLSVAKRSATTTVETTATTSAGQSE